VTATATRRSGGPHRHQRLWSHLSPPNEVIPRCAGCESRRPVRASWPPPSPRRDSRRCGQPRDVRDVGVAGAPAGAVVHHRRQLHSALGASPPPRPAPRATATATTAPATPPGRRRGRPPSRRRLAGRRRRNPPRRRRPAGQSPKIHRRAGDSALPNTPPLVYKRNQHGDEGEGRSEAAIAAADAARAAGGRCGAAAGGQQPERPRRPAQGRGAQADAAGAGARRAWDAAVPRPPAAGARGLARDPGGRGGCAGPRRTPPCGSR
jgi:hypothetical protein